MDPPQTAPSEWISTHNCPVAVNRRGGGLAGCEVVGNNKPVRRRRRVIRRWGSNSDESPSPPPPPPRIKLPISPGRYGTLRSPPMVRRRPTWTGPPPPREEYVYVPRFRELTPSPPRGDGSVRPPFRWATPHQATERPARRLTFSATQASSNLPKLLSSLRRRRRSPLLRRKALRTSIHCPKCMSTTIGMDFQSIFHSIPPQRSGLHVIEKLIDC